MHLPRPATKIPFRAGVPVASLGEARRSSGMDQAPQVCSGVSSGFAMFPTGCRERSLLQKPCAESTLPLRIRISAALRGGAPARGFRLIISQTRPRLTCFNPRTTVTIFPSEICPVVSTLRFNCSHEVAIRAVSWPVCAMPQSGSLRTTSISRHGGVYRRLAVARRSPSEVVAHSSPTSQRMSTACSVGGVEGVFSTMIFATGPVRYFSGKMFLGGGPSCPGGVPAGTSPDRSST